MTFEWPGLGQGDAGRFAQAYDQIGVSLRFFTTENGHMGMAPVWAEIGDVAAILYGAKTRLLLRPIPDGFSVVGSCYVHGMMYGEYVQRLRQHGILEPCTKTFTLSCSNMKPPCEEHRSRLSRPVALEI